MVSKLIKLPSLTLVTNMTDLRDLTPRYLLKHRILSRAPQADEKYVVVSLFPAYVLIQYIQSGSVNLEFASDTVLRYQFLRKKISRNNVCPPKRRTCEFWVELVVLFFYPSTFNQSSQQTIKTPALKKDQKKGEKIKRKEKSRAGTVYGILKLDLVLYCSIFRVLTS